MRRTHRIWLPLSLIVMMVGMIMMIMVITMITMIMVIILFMMITHRTALSLSLSFEGLRLEVHGTIPTLWGICYEVCIRTFENMYYFEFLYRASLVPSQTVLCALRIWNLELLLVSIISYRLSIQI